ncbi:odorant receptor 49a-like [Lycorma delicatula]|uniref:odorant receptor 49a-like n=1 Tax=Lycorma delicatula TaxID=130591 RepID=UPI003F515DC7
MKKCDSLFIVLSGENLRKGLYEFPWVDKPEQLKKALLIVMCRTRKPIEIIPLGLHVLNLKNFGIKSDIYFKISEGLQCLVATYLTYLLDVSGENIITEGENLRNAFYEFSWIDKPESLKKALLIVMAQSNIPIQIKPLGLHVLNLKNFALVMNAAYSYYNLLNTFDKKN